MSVSQGRMEIKRLSMAGVAERMKTFRAALASLIAVCVRWWGKGGSAWIDVWVDRQSSWWWGGSSGLHG